MPLESFPPIIANDAKVLILGTMPSVVSLQKQQYYAHKRNDFWPILFALWNLPSESDYDKRQKFLFAHKIAVWDVVASCEREGSSDSRIKKEQPNNIVGLLNDYPSIHHVFFNGNTAYRLFIRHFGNSISLQHTQLPSTSPAHTLPFAQKLHAWSAVRLAVENCFNP